MLIGQYEHSLDAKGRMNFPAKFREDLGDRFIITKGLDACAAVYSFAEWQLLADKIKRQPEAKAALLKRFFFAGAVEVEPDKQGRIVLPAHLREYAGLQKDVIISGVMDKAEIWDKDCWNSKTVEMTPDAMLAAITAMEDF